MAGRRQSRRYQPPEGFMTMGEAAERMRLNIISTWRAVKEGRLQVYADGRDRRVRLVTVADIDQLMRPRPIPATTVTPAQRLVRPTRQKPAAVAS